MCETLAELKQACSAFAARFDAALVPPGQLAQVLADAGTIEKLFANIAALSAARMAGGAGGALCAKRSLAWRTPLGHRSAKRPKPSKPPRQIEAQPEVARAVRCGELSRQQAGLVAGAVANKPSAAPQLLELARSASMRELAEESLRTRSSGQGAEARRQAVHGSRLLRCYTSTDGAFNLHAEVRQNKVPW